MSLAVRSIRHSRVGLGLNFSPSISRNIAGPSRLPLSSPSSTSLLHASPARQSYQLVRTDFHRSFATIASPSTPRPRSDHDSGPEPEPDAPASASVTAKLRALMKKYGKYAIVMYTALSLVDFSLCFLAVHSIGADKIEPYISSGFHFYRVKRYGEEGAERIESAEKKEKEEKLAQEREADALLTPEERKRKKNSGWGSRALWAEIALAYGIHKTALLPFRAGLTVAWTPKVVAWLTARGWVGKGGATRAATHAGEKMRDASTHAGERVRDASTKVKDLASKARNR
ncbi:N-terminal acetyltransferase 2, partial [Tremellales sp. Uapishka_1]